MTSRDMDTIPMYTAILVFVTVVLMASRQVVSEEDQRLTTDQACVNIYPSDDQCEAWARFGECEMNREWMEQNCRYSCHFCDVDQSQNRTPATQKPAASSNLAPSDSALTDPENIHLQNITLNSTVDVFTSNEWEEPELALGSTSSSNSSATKRTSLWQVSNQTTTNSLSIFYNHLSASTDGMDDAYQPEDVTEEPHFEMDNNEAPESSELVSEVQGNDMLTSSPNRMKTSEPSSGQRTSAAPDKEETSIIAAVWNTSVSVDFIEVTTAPSRQVTSAYEQSGVMELTVQPDETTSVGDKAKNKSSENEAEYPSSLKPTIEVDDSSILDRKTTTRMEMEITPSRKMSSEITMIMTTMGKFADEEMTERIQPASNDTAPHTAFNVQRTSQSLDLTSSTRQITDEMSTTASNDTSIQSSTERSTAADTKTSTTVTSSALGFTERGMTDGVVTNMTTRSTTTTEAQCVNRWDLDTGSLDCEGWAAIGECEKNSIWMWQYCQKACQKCRSTDDDDASGNTTLIGQCDDGQFRCLDTRECIEGAKICDGAKDCGDGSDEDDSICKVTFTCLESQYQCVDGLCIGRQLLCDGQIDCTSSEDEDSTLCQSITTMTGLKTSLISTNEITLSWTATYNSHELITGYEVSYHPVDDPTNTVTFTYDTYVTLVTFYDLKPDTQYVFTVKPIVLYFDTQGTTITARTSAVVCINVYTEDPTMCDIWASSGECEKNPWWMSRYCARSCKVCVAESTAGQTMPSPTLESTAGTTAGELSLDTTSTSWETAVAEARSSLLAAVLTTAASSRVLYNDTTAVQSTSGSSEKADVSFKASFTTAVPPAAKSVTTAESMEEQVTFLYSTAAPPPTAAPITAVSESAASSTAVNMSGPVTTESGSFHPTTAAYTAGSGAVKPTTAVGEDITDNEHTESKRDVGSTKEPAQPVDALLIYAEALDGSIMVLDLRQPGSKKMIGQSQKPVAIGYDPVTQTVFWSDVLEHRIYKKSLIEDGDTEVLLNVEDGLGITEGMAIDSYNQRLYFSHYYTQVVDGITLKWHSIDVLDLVNGSRHTVVSDLDSPRGLWVDSWNGYLFYTDVGAGKVVRCNLDGSDRFVIRSGLISPNAVVYDGHVVYVIDSNYGGAELGGLYKTDINGQNWQKVTSGIDDLKVPFAMTLGNNKLYITEWESHSIITYDTISERSSVFSDAYLPMGITYSILKQDKTDDVRCEESGCGGMCLHGANQEAVCYCPSYGVDVLQTDGTSCSKPKSYMLVADANTIKMLSFASNELIVHTAIQGDLLTLYSALIVTENGTVYYTDTNRQIIYMTTLQDGATVQELFKAYNYIDGLAYNPTTSMLYWTAYGDGSIMQLNINSLAYSITHSGLEKPRDIVIDVVNGYMYWTELGVAPKVMRSYIDGSKKEAILASPLSNPNGLYLDQVTETLYILDSAKMMNKTIVYVCENMNASEVSCQELMSIKTADLLYGIYVYGNILYFSDWSTPSVHYYDRTSEMFGIVSSQFIRPTQLAVYGDVPDHCIDAPCSEICVSLLHTFTCHCSEDRGPLLDDGWTCKKDGSPAVIVHITDKRRAVAGFNVTLTCEVKGIPQPTLSWFKVLPSGERMMLPGNDGRISLPAYNVLNIRDTRKTDSGIYACVAGNQYGYTENVTEITVIASTVIIQSPQDVTAVRGLESVMFNCVVAHDPSVSVTISWYHDQTFINTTTAPDYVVYENGSLLVMDVKREHAGIYSCHATSEIGDEEAMAMLTVQEEPEKPTLVSVLPNKNDLFAVDLTWTPGNNHNSVITAYIIEERIIERGVVYEEKEGWLKVANVSGMTTTYTLTGLNTYTYYEFRVKAQNGVGLSKPSSENFGYLTPELEPGAAPLHVMASVQTMDSLYITWDQLPYPAHNGILLGYIVRYKETGADDSKFRYKNTTNSDATGIQISGLKPYQQYDVSVAAYNSQGRGPFSEAVTLMTKEGVPSGRVQQVEVSVVNSTAVQVSWLPLNPDTTYGVIRGYKVQFHRIDGTRYQMVLVPAQGESGNKLWVTISGLQPMAIYEITIAAYTAKGDGPISNPSKVVLPASASSTTSSTATKTTTVKTTVTTGVINTTTGSSVHLETTSVSNPTKVPDIISSSEAQPIATATTTRVTTTESTPSPVVTENMDTGPVWISEEDEVSTLTPGKPTTKYPTFPPKFIYCPEDQLVTVSSGFAPTVWWREPVVQDYYANPVRLSSNYKPGSKFEVGSTQIVYIAIDRRGVNATCFFKVNVEAQDFTCTGVPQLVNGYIKCDRVNYIYTCHAQCNTGYQVAAQYNGSHQCLTTGWTPNYKVGFASLACIKSERIMNKNSIVLTFIGSCPSDMNSFKTNFLQQIESRLRQKSLCDNEDTNFIEQYTCNRFNYQLSCKNAQALRQKRDADQLTLEMPVFIPSQNMTPEASKLIEERKQELEQVFLTDHSLIVDNMSFRFSKIAVMQDGLTCPTGWVNKGYKCEQCPAGTYLDLLSGQCQLCAAGSYQDQEAQLSCKQCPAGKTSAVGFFTENQCYMPMASTDAPEPGSNSIVPGIDQTTVIIIVIAVIGGVLLLTAMIVAGVAVRNTCQRRRTLNLEKQKKQQIMNGKEYPQQYTNIAYAGVPPVKQAANGKRPSAKVVRASSSSSQISQSSTVIIPTRRNPMAYNAEVSVNLNSHSGQTLPTQIPGKSMNGNQPAVLTSRGTEVRAYSRGTGQSSSSARLSPDGTVLRQASPSTPSSDGPHQPVQVIPAQPIMPGNLPPGQYRKLPSGQIIRLVPINKPVKKNSHSKRYEMKRAVTKRPGPAGTVPHQGVFKKNVPVTAVSGYGTYPPRPARIVATAQGGRVVSSSSVRTKRDHGWNALTLLDKTST